MGKPAPASLRNRIVEIAPEYVAVALERWLLTTKKEPEMIS